MESVTAAGFGLPADRVVWALRRAELAVQAEKERVLRPLGLAGSHFTFLATLSGEAGLTGAELARRIGVTPQAVASLLVRLEERGLVERRLHPRHRHIQELHLTSAGISALAEADEVIEAVEESIVAILGSVPAKQLRAQLEALAAGVGGE